MHDHLGSHVQHSRVSDLRMGRGSVHSVFRHFAVLHEHVATGNTVVVEGEESVVDTVHSHLGSDVSDTDSRECGIGISVADRNEEWVWAMVLRVDNQVRNKNNMSTTCAETSWPPGDIHLFMNLLKQSYHLVAVVVGVWITNSSVLLS